jgi:hypothetical protein
LKRQRERAQAERRQEKAQRRLQSRARRTDTPRRADGEDPDIAGITPGPQASPYHDFEFPHEVAADADADADADTDATPDE